MRYITSSSLPWSFKWEFENGPSKGSIFYFYFLKELEKDYLFRKAYLFIFETYLNSTNELE